MTHISNARLVRLASELSPRRWELLRAVEAMRLITGGQLRRRFYGAEGPSAARLARLDLAAMTDLGILHRLKRTIGGRRAGSSAFIYAQGPVGLRLLDLASGEGLKRGRTRYEPSVGFVEHALAVTEVWVSLHEYIHDPWTREHDTQVEFRVEQAAWREHSDAFGGPLTLKPDAEVRLSCPDYDDVWWLEVDRATERRSMIKRKLAAYTAYYRSGTEQRRSGVFPLTAWLTTTEERAAVLREVIAELPHRDRALFRVGLLSAAAPFLLSQGRNDP